MNPRISAGILVLVAFVAFPLPMLGFEGSVPAARFAQLAGAGAIIGLTEGTYGMIGTITALFAAHAAGYAVALALLGWLLARYALPRLHHRVRDHVTVILSVLLLSIGIYGELYNTQFHHTSAHAKLLELYR